MLVAVLVVVAALAYADATCPRQRVLVVETSLVFSFDEYQGLPPSSPPCTLSVQSASGADLLVSVNTFKSFSLRQPMSNNDLVLRDGQKILAVDRVPKMYLLFSSPITLEIPRSLSFRAVVVVSATAACDDDSFNCSEFCDLTSFQNCTSVCISKAVRCDSFDNCLTDEQDCANNTGEYVPSKSSFRYHSIPASSQLMMVGFFVLNGAFILFFLTLSACSVSACFSRKLFFEKSRASRLTFVKYLREASASVTLSVKKSSPSSFERRPTDTSLPRINFAPSTALRELEPEAEDRSIRTPKEEICSLPAYQPQIYMRRQSLPVSHNPTQALLKWKRTSVAH